MFNLSDPPQPLKTLILVVLEAFWVHQTLLDMPRTIVANSHFGKRPTAREMITFVCHVGAQSANPYWCNFPNLAVWPFPGLIFVFLLLPCAWDIELWVYHLWRIVFLWICWFSIIFKVRWRCVWGAFQVRLTCVWGAFEARGRCVYRHHHHYHIKAFRALVTTGAWE